MNLILIILILLLLLGGGGGYRLEEGFDAFAEKECLRFYKSETMGRPSIAPGVYFRMLLIGYFEGVGTWNRMAVRRFEELEEFSGIRPDGRDTSRPACA